MNLQGIAARITKKCGVAVDVESRSEDGERQFEVRFSDLHPNETISARVVVEFRGVRSDVAFGPFAGMTLERLARAGAPAMERFASHCKAIRDSGISIEIELDGTNVPISSFAGRRGQWTRIRWFLKSRPMVVPSLETDLGDKLVAHWATLTLSLALDLLEIEPAALANVPSARDLRVEGQEIEVLAKRYERDRIARELCISHFGYACAVCECVLADVYGEIGESFIHVHHKNPLSLRRAEGEVDPVNDLVPVCPNCHAMLHQRTPPYSVEDLKKMLKDRTVR